MTVLLVNLSYYYTLSFNALSLLSVMRVRCALSPDMWLHMVRYCHGLLQLSLLLRCGSAGGSRCSICLATVFSAPRFSNLIYVSLNCTTKHYVTCTLWSSLTVSHEIYNIAHSITACRHNSRFWQTHHTFSISLCRVDLSTYKRWCCLCVPWTLVL